MSDGLLGLDPDAARHLAALLAEAADDLRSGARWLTASLGETVWEGPDSDGFRRDWELHRLSLERAAEALDDACREVLAAGAAQGNASSVS